MALKVVGPNDRFTFVWAHSCFDTGVIPPHITREGVDVFHICTKAQKINLKKTNKPKQKKNKTKQNKTKKKEEKKPVQVLLTSLGCFW